MPKARTFKTRVLERRINRFENACKALAFVGAAHPDEHEEIEAEHKAARTALWNYILENAGVSRD